MNRLVVVKVGSAVLSDNSGNLNQKRFSKIARDIVCLRENKFQVVVVSSGAILAAMHLLGIKKRPDKIEELQKLAAIGQPLLIDGYAKALKKRRLVVAQILLSHDDFERRTSFINARHTILSLAEEGFVPIINENDTVAVEEIKVGDNDTLSALVAGAIGADALIIMSNIPGIINPSTGKVVREISPLENPEKYDMGVKTPAGVGGIATKFQAARIAATHGIPTYLGDGRKKNLIPSFLKGEFSGTFFPPLKSRLRGKKKWIALLQKPKGKIVIDKGAESAILKRGKSLLPGGVAKVEGRFARGDMVEVLNEEGKPVAKGIVNYSSDELEQIKGKKSSEIVKILGYRYTDEVIHRDELILTMKP